jgi:hypothetical protein
MQEIKTAVGENNAMAVALFAPQFNNEAVFGDDLTQA